MKFVQLENEFPRTVWPKGKENGKMFDDVQETLDEVLELWERIQASNEEDAESDANRFQDDLGITA